MFSAPILYHVHTPPAECTLHYSVTHCGIYITRTLYKTDHNKQLKVMALNDHSETTTKSTYSQDELPELLPLYYRRLFPYNQYYRWLNYGGRKRTMSTNIGLIGHYCID